MSSLPSQSADGATPGSRGVFRFLVLSVIVLGVMCGSIVGLFYAIKKTSRAEYQGPDKLVYPEHRYYR